MTDIRPRSYWVHKHRSYEVQVDPIEDLTFKEPGDANERPVVVFRKTEEEDQHPTSRFVDDFLAKFTPVLRDEGDV